jgi:peptidoglycan/LPS O-acetylase OafA/YrhL
VETTGRSIPYIVGVRGVSALYVASFHLNNLILQAPGAVLPAWYHRLTDWMRYGDFRVAAFFVISGFLLTIPVTRSSTWSLPAGVRGFMLRRAERLLVPYYVALGVSIVLFLVWAAVAGATVHPRSLALGIAAHLLLVHNLDPRTMLYLSDPLWNVALEFQCYLLFALVLLPAMRRFGVWRPFAAVVVLALVPHFAFGGWLDYARPWFVILYALGVAMCALANPSYPALLRQDARMPWGTLWILAALATPIAIRASGIDAPYGAGWLQNLLLGVSVGAFVLFMRRGAPGPLGPLARGLARGLEVRPLRVLGAFSYSIYLIHFPVLRLLVAIAARFTHSGQVIAGLSLFAFLPLTLALAYAFHLAVERRFILKRGAGPIGGTFFPPAREAVVTISAASAE